MKRIGILFVLSLSLASLGACKWTDFDDLKEKIRKQLEALLETSGKV